LDKNDIVQEMLDIGLQIQTLKDSGDSARIDALQLQYRTLSERLGGDDPAQVLQSSTAWQDVNGGMAFIAGPAPSGTTPTTTNFLQNTPVAIVDNATVTSMILVSTSSTYLWDIDLRTFITHTFSSDLDITLISPQGTVVTVTTDNGSGFDNCFNGTTWDDSVATPATDRVYANLVVATPLIPEGAFGKFIGENPNGMWTIAIFDDATGDVGSLVSWDLDVTTLDYTPVTAGGSYSDNTPVAIVDNATVTSMILVSGAGPSVVDVNLTAFITHTFSSDLDITLRRFVTLACVR
jgi:subtilisin-like proprotein convertase family protein